MGTKKEKIKKLVIELYQEHYGIDQSESDILSTDPNGFDRSPEQFYEAIENTFSVQADYDENPYYGGLGGTITELIAFLETHGTIPGEINGQNEFIHAFFENFHLNCKKLDAHHVNAYFDMYGMMESNRKEKEIKKKFRIALKTNNWEDLLSIGKQYSGPFDITGLTTIAELID
ncbi:hypothetical protein ACFSTE_11410 [Aquimarina hainanensis]|uniref:Uncharacterized protein n=1 Tax=Aquimarina hainanensis TaxID=1578017 RepID=A0ABW5N982_9FLAO